MSIDNENPYAAPSETSDLASDSLYPNDLATRGERFAGALIDGIIMLPVVLGAGMVLGFGMVAAGIDPQSLAFQVLASVIGGLLGVAAFLAINGYLLATKGQTVGKLVMKTQILSDSTNSLVPFGRLVLLRYVPLWIASAIPFIGNFVGIIDGLAIFRENRKCIHDEIAGTKVIKLRG
ncbi:RDD family protein [Planctomycetes bacterium CA13]|uniref:RDD family protein n=1 Tax=Novipirellula herctigrandis TaxID=2527986 RepID=A0A5C5Z5N1_9BACT|nr:RDD family protein [Planctomycetes bacterium CA13]